MHGGPPGAVGPLLWARPPRPVRTHPRAGSLGSGGPKRTGMDRRDLRFRGSPGIRGGDVLTLTNRARRVLTRLHVAHLRVDIKATQTVIASGRCEPGLYYGPRSATRR